MYLTCVHRATYRAYRLEDEPFKDRLRRWRGIRRRCVVAKILGVSVRTYESWEAGYFKPTEKPSIREIEQKMKEQGGMK